jgi:hypothetical protein
LLFCGNNLDSYNCRIEFKRGLASELGHDFQGALKYHFVYALFASKFLISICMFYDRAFKLLREIPMTARVTEHKVLILALIDSFALNGLQVFASFIAFKLWSLLIRCAMADVHNCFVCIDHQCLSISSNAISHAKELFRQFIQVRLRNNFSALV